MKKTESISDNQKIADVLVATDQKKVDILISERRRFCVELNDGLELLRGLPFVEEGQGPTLEDLGDPVSWWNDRILGAIQPKVVKGFPPDPRQQALGYSVDYDQHVKEINLVPWVAMDLAEFVNDKFEVTEAIEQKVRESASIFATPEQAKEFAKLDTLLDLLNEYTDKYVSDKINLNAIASGLWCKYVQLEDRSRKIVPDARALIHVMEHVAANS